MTHRNRDVYDRSHKILLLPVGAVVTAMDGGNAGNAGAVSGRPPWMAEMPETQEQFPVDRQG